VSLLVAVAILLFSVLWSEIFSTTMSTRKRITELTVMELKSQLTKRGVDATGDRPALIVKLKKVCCYARRVVTEVAIHPRRVH